MITIKEEQYVNDFDQKKKKKVLKKDIEGVTYMLEETQTFYLRLKRLNYKD